MVTPIRILLLASSELDRLWLIDALRGSRFEAECVRVDPSSVDAALTRTDWDAIVCSVHGALPNGELELARRCQAVTGRVPILVADSFEDVAPESHRSGALVCLRERGFSHLGPALERQRVRREPTHQPGSDGGFERQQQAVLERIARGGKLAELLERIVLLVEQQGGMTGSILLLDQGRVRHGAAPHLPSEFVRAIDGSEIGPSAGSCGAAAYRRERVVVDDIASHPNWDAYRQFALPFGLRACWSSPIFGAGGDVLGTFALYYAEPRGPNEREELWVKRATHLASIAIERDRAEQALRLSEARYRQIVDTAYEGVWLVDSDARTLLVNERAAQMLGYESHEMIGRSLFDFIDVGERAALSRSLLRRKQNISEQHEFCLKRKDGTPFWVIIASSPVRDERGGVIGALGMITDITELKRAEAALRQSEAEFRVIFESAAIGMALVSVEGRPLRSNPALERMLGYAERELRDMPFAAFTHPDDVAPDLALYQELVAGERESYQIEKRYVCKDGALIWGRLTVSLVRDPNAEPRFCIGMVEDITDRKQMEEAVRSSERLRTLVYNGVSDVLFYVGVEGEGAYRFLSVNPAFCKATGLAEAQVTGRLIGEVIPEPSRALVLANYAKAIRERRSVSWEEVSVYPAGKRYGEAAVTPMFDASGRCTHLVGTVHDVTERRRAEEQIREQATLLDRARDAILVRDVDGTVRYWNKGAERVYGWSSAEAVGKSVRELIYAEPGALDRAQARLLEAGEWTGEVAHVSKAGKPLMIEARWTLLRDERGQPKSVLAINSDITERKRLEAHAQRTERLESLGALAGSIAHDFNNILVAIVANAGLALHDLAPGHPARESLVEIDKASARARDLVRQILTFSRQSEPRRELIAIPPIVSEVLRLLRVTAHACIEFETQFSPAAPKILADPTQLHRVVMNLGANALQAMDPSGGTLKVSVELAQIDSPPADAPELRAGRYAVLLVADTGSGMDEHTVERIFEPLFTTKEPGTGTGLGLSVVHGIVKSHHGCITVQSTRGQGSAFRVFWPAAE